MLEFKLEISFFHYNTSWKILALIREELNCKWSVFPLNLILILGWQNPAILVNGTSHSSETSIERPHSPPQVRPTLNTVTPNLRSASNRFGITPMRNGARDDSRIDGICLSCGFAPNVTPCHIPNVQRNNSLPIEENSDAEDNPVEKKQIETLCRAIRVPDEDLPIYSFGYSTVRHFSILLAKKDFVVKTLS